jgi:hypothetical protein
MTPDTSRQEPKLSDAIQLGKLTRMLQSIVRRYPQTRLQVTSEGFGVLLEGGTWMRVSYAGRWTPMALRDFLALFAAWLVVDEQRILNGGEMLAGVSQTVHAELLQSQAQQDSRV